MQRLVALEQDVVRDVDDVADRPHPRLHEALLHPRGRFAHRDARRRRPGSAGSASGASTTTVTSATEASTAGRRRASGIDERLAEVGGELAGDADDAHRVGPVRRDREVEHDVVEAEDLADVGAELVAASSSRMPEWSSPRPSSFAEHSMPSETTPRILRRSSLKPPGSCAPAGANGAIMPA